MEWGLVGFGPDGCDRLSSNSCVELSVSTIIAKSIFALRLAQYPMLVGLSEKMPSMSVMVLGETLS